MEADAAFRDAVLRFLRTGSLEDVPARVVLPAPDWGVPGELPAVR